MGAPMALAAFPDLVSALGKTRGKGSPFDFAGAPGFGTRGGGGPGLIGPPDRIGGGGPRFIGPPDSTGGPGRIDTPTGERAPMTLGRSITPGGLADAISRIGQPPMPSPGQLPGAVSGEQLLGAAPGLDQLPGMGGFTSIMDRILGFGSSGPSYEESMASFGLGGPGDPNQINPYQNMLRNLFGGLERRGAYSG